MKIIVEPGQPVQLDARRSTSVGGGIYDISDLPAERRKALLKLKGVREYREEKAAAKPAAEMKEGE